MKKRPRDAFFLTTALLCHTCGIQRNRVEVRHAFRGNKNCWKKSMLRPEHKSIALMCHLNSKFRQPRTMVLNRCVSAGATAKDSLLLLKYQKFICFAADSDIMSMKRPFLLRMFSEKVPGSESHILEPQKVQTAENEYAKLSSVKGEAKPKLSWNRPQ